jgi:hypothetical protein
VKIYNDRTKIYSQKTTGRESNACLYEYTVIMIPRNCWSWEHDIWTIYYKILPFYMREPSSATGRVEYFPFHRSVKYLLCLLSNVHRKKALLIFSILRTLIKSIIYKQPTTCPTSFMMYLITLSGVTRFDPHFYWTRLLLSFLAFFVSYSCRHMQFLLVGH